MAMHCTTFSGREMSTPEERFTNRQHCIIQSCIRSLVVVVVRLLDSSVVVVLRLFRQVQCQKTVLQFNIVSLLHEFDYSADVMVTLSLMEWNVICIAGSIRARATVSDTLSAQLAS